MQNEAAGSKPPSLRQAIRVWAKIGLLSFGGPAAQIALMHRMIVDEKQWLNEKEYLNALSFCMLLPGPEAMQLATYAGWRLHGVIGGLAAGLLFVLPGAFVILALAAIYSLFGSVPLVSALFLGIKAAVIVVVIEALLRVAKKALTARAHWVIAAAAFAGLFFLNLPYPLIILVAAIVGYLQADKSTATSSVPQNLGRLIPGTVLTIVVWLLIWWLPIVALHLAVPDSILGQLGRFFSTLAVVTFGGAYAVLAFLAQDVVNQFGWLTAGEMMDGLGLAETTPGPLILVTEFVGFIAAFREGGLLLGLAGAVVTLWVTFVPCFLWIFAGAPYLEWICAQPRLKGALSGITAAVVGVILNLSLWFGLHVFFDSVQHLEVGVLKIWWPDWASLNGLVVLLTLLCAVLAFGIHWGIGRILLVSAVLGLVLQPLFG